jgi:hypothetical protein
LNADARIRRPRSVPRNSSTNPTITAATARMVKTPKPVSAIVVSPSWNPRSPNGAGNDRNREPKTIAASAWNTMKSPRVRITALISDLPSTGRTTNRSTSAPSTSPDSSATAKPSQ